MLSRLIEKMEPPFTASTFTLWRRVALKRVRKEVLGITHFDDDEFLDVEMIRKCRAVMHFFSTKVDCEKLDGDYLKVITQMY